MARSSSTSSASSAASAASATASKLAADAEQGLSGLSKFSITIAAIVTVLAIVAAGIYFAGYADDIGRWGAKQYYAGKAKAEITAMGKVGGEKAEGFLKGESLRLRVSPLLGIFLYDPKRRRNKPLVQTSCVYSRWSLANSTFRCFLTDSLKQNPIMGKDELEQVAPGLGAEAVQDGLAGVSSKLGGLGKL